MEAKTCPKTVGRFLKGRIRFGNKIGPKGERRRLEV